MSPTRIMIFAKAPVPGQAKTRLIPALGSEGAARLARSMLVTTMEEALAAAVGMPELCADPDPLHAVWSGLIPNGIHASSQGQGDLGDRLARAARRGIGETGAVLLIGTDCPDLHRHRLRCLAVELQRVDALICPAEDGGYVALGLRRFHSSVFSGIAWSTQSVAGETIRHIEQLGWSLHLGETLRDVDRPEDLENMRTKAATLD